MTDHRDVIAAFADLEPVDVETLSAALADPEAREYFMDILLLRGMVGGAEPVEPKKAQTPRYRALAAAAFITIGLGTGFLAARVMLDRNGDQIAQDDAIVSPVQRPAESATAAPPPTHVIRLESGVEWNERSGGK